MISERGGLTKEEHSLPKISSLRKMDRNLTKRPHLRETGEVMIIIRNSLKKKKETYFDKL